MAGNSINRTSSSSTRHLLPPQELLDDLCSRFVLNVPKEDLESFERILFLLEQAHWFYEDNSVEQNSSLKSLSFKEFTSLMFNSCATLRPYIDHIDDIYKDFTSYKFRIPVTGAIILDESHERCLLVKGWKSGASWSFPRGKKNKDEEDHTCAARELIGLNPFVIESGKQMFGVHKDVYVICVEERRRLSKGETGKLECFLMVLEETGFDVSMLLKLDEYIEVVIGPQRVRLYIVGGVKDDTAFAPLTKKEISEISWHHLDELLPAGEEAISRGANGLKLYMVAPFLTALKAWIVAHPSPAGFKSETSSKVTCVWKVKSNLGSGSLAVDNLTNSQNAADVGPGRSFRNFRFDVPRILQAMEASFSAS